MSAYEELHKRCYDLTEAGDEDVHIILGEVFRTLEMVTPEMRQAEAFSEEMSGPVAEDVFLAMLRASPLAFKSETSIPNLEDKVGGGTEES